MQRFILSKKKPITFISALLLVAAYTSHYGFGSGDVARTAMIVASVLEQRPFFFKPTRL